MDVGAWNLELFALPTNWGIVIHKVSGLMARMSFQPKFTVTLFLGFICLRGMADNSSAPDVKGLTGHVKNIRITVEAPQVIAPLSAGIPTNDVDLKRMAAWAMNYLIRTPNKDFDYEPVFQCHPLRCPPTPSRRDVVVPCDTDARMNWEWYYMRDVSGSSDGKDVEEGFHKRMLSYVQDDGTVLCPPGC